VLANAVLRVFGVALLLTIGVASSARSAPTPESGVVAFMRGGDIFAANVDGSGEKNLTRVGIGFARYPDVSPDGTMIAFDELIEDGPDLRVAVIGTDGSGLRRVGNVTRGGGPVWSPDGRLIAYGGPPDRRLDVVAPDGSGLRTLASDAREFGFSWSPDGREIAYGSDNRLRAVDLVTGRSRNLAATAGASNIAWSPDGAKIAFMRFADEVWLVDRDGSGLHRLAKAEFVGAPRWSPDSRQIAVPIDEEYPVKPTRILLFEVAAGSSRALASAEFGEGSDSPSWSPDGSRIAYERGRFSGVGSGSSGARSDRDIWITNADGGGKVEVTFAFPLGTSASEPEWVPGLARIEPDVEIGATVAARPRRVIKMSALVEELVADEIRALFDGDEFGVWSVRTGKVQRLPGCDVVDEQRAIAGTRVAWVCGEEGLSFVHESLMTATVANPRPLDVVHLNYRGLSVAGGGSLMVFSTGRKIWRLDGRQRHLLRIERAAARAISVAAGRALLERRDGSLAVVGSSGKVIRTFHFARRPLRAELSRQHLIVLALARGVRVLEVYRLRDGKRIRSWPTAGGDTAELQSAHGRFAVYLVGIAIHVIDLMNGHVVVLGFRQQAGPTNAHLVPAGLVYSYGEAYSKRPGRLGIIPTAAFVESFR
jgi:Tol biopolymer transport system component